MSKLSLRGLFHRPPREKKTLSPEMRQMLNSYEPLHPEQPTDDGNEPDASAESPDDERRSAA